MSRRSQISGMVVTSAATTVSEEAKFITTATPVIQPAMPITEGILMISTAFENQNRSPFLQVTQSWNLVPPTQNVSLPQFTGGSKPNDATHNGRIPQVRLATGNTNGLLIGSAVGGVLGGLLLLGGVWYFLRTRKKKKCLREDESTQFSALEFLRKLGLKRGSFRSKSPCYSDSDLESITSFGDHAYVGSHTETSSNSSPQTPPPILQSEKIRYN